jgi:hypothetical protein
MSLKSDVTVDAAKFDRSTIDKQTLEFNDKLIKIWADGPRWYEVCNFLSILHTSPTALRHTHHTHPRSEQQRTGKCAGKAKHLCPNPLCYPKA